MAGQGVTLTGETRSLCSGIQSPKRLHVCLGVKTKSKGFGEDQAITKRLTALKPTPLKIKLSVINAVA